MIRVKDSWATLKGVDDWTKELSILMDEAGRVAQSPDAQTRLQVAEYLTGFIQESWPQTPEMDRLDGLAQRAVGDLMDATIATRLASIASRTAEFVKLAKDLSAAAAAGQSAADAIRLTGVKNLIDSATQTITSAKSLAVSLDETEPGDKKLADLIEKTIAAVDKLRSAAAGSL